MAWKACSPWQREFNTHQQSTMFHENGRFFLPAHLSSYFSNPLAYASEQLFSSTGSYACHRPNTHLPSGGTLLRAAQVPLINIYRTRLFISDVCPFRGTDWVTQWHILTAKGQRDCPDEIRLIHLLLYPGFSSWCWLSRAQSPSPQEAGKYPNVSFMLQWISCKSYTISSPGYFPVTYTSHIMFCHSEVSFGTH